MKKNFKLLITMLCIFSFCIGCGSDKNKNADIHEENADTPQIASLEAVDEEDIVILFTTDVHHKLDDYIGYDGVAAYKKEAAKKCTEDNLLLLDCGDCLDGGNLGESTYGSAIFNIMEKVGYDVATPGNHDFKYGIDNLKELASEADFAYISCNIRDIASGNAVFEPYTILEKGGKKIAVIGVSTCQNAFSYEGCTDFIKENPKYDFWQDGFYERIQEIIQEVKSKDADYVILLTHLGYESEELEEFSSSELVRNVSGVDAVIDGHAHMELEGELLTDKEGKEVIITSSGEWLKNIGQMVIHPDGSIETQLIPMIDYLDTDPEISQYIEQLEAE